MNPTMYKPGEIYEKAGYIWGERLVIEILINFL